MTLLKIPVIERFIIDFDGDIKKMTVDRFIFGLGILP
jgi:hypothetical protein